MLTKDNFIWIRGERYFITERPPEEGEWFHFEDNGISYCAQCYAISSDGTKVIRECDCGNCEYIVIPVEKCKKISYSPIHYN